ncbi:TIGR02391 family protein [Mycolicibacterium neoaurum]|uniref:TIGR02391 family protein n=1 Tax=Mycolicibacterium neoaurum TaxID=1795 RepID=UPI001F4D0C06|nr:TIGR02391 family protein [Mycolicibacterium neoaurum]
MDRERGLIGSGDTWRHVTTLGREVAEDGNAVAKAFAADRLSGKRDPALEFKVRLTFGSGDYETAAFSAMKEVEVAVRRTGGFDNSLIGVPLIRQAFARDGGPLPDPDAEPGERVAKMELFTGSIGVFDNPSSHRGRRNFQLADLLLRIVRRAKRRTGYKPKLKRKTPQQG